MTNYLATLKQNNEVISQRIMTAEETLNFIRKWYIKMNNIEETSADLNAIKAMNDIEPGRAIGLDGINNRKVVFQVHN